MTNLITASFLALVTACVVNPSSGPVGTGGDDTTTGLCDTDDCVCPTNTSCVHECIGGGPECHVQGAPGESTHVTCDRNGDCHVECSESSSCEGGLAVPISASTAAGAAYARRRSGSGGPETRTPPGISHAGYVIGIR